MKLTPEEIRAVQKRENWQNECEYIDALFQAELAKLQMNDEQVRDEIEKILHQECLSHKECAWCRTSSYDSEKDAIVCTDKRVDQLTALIATKEQKARQELIQEIESTLSLSENEMGFIEISNHVPYGKWQEIKE